MRHDVILPKQGIYEGEVELIEWLVPDRSRVEADTPIFLLGTDKVEVEIAAPVTGWLVQEESEGFTAMVGTRIGFVATEEGDLP
jgi:2-oxoglutarate dehydrogenase E2 component (dihydrolipoamide succinyltransferase)